MDRVWVGSAAKPGPEHYRRRINCQDQVYYFRDGLWIFGADSDGCSAARMSETGAGSLVHAATQILCKAITGDIPITEILAYFSCEMHDFMYKQILSYPFGQQYLDRLRITGHQGRKVDLTRTDNYLAYEAISDMLQATLLTVCLHEERGGLILVRGDGYVYIDGSLTPFDYNDEPPYLIYDFAVDKYPGDPDDLSFKLVEVPPGFTQVGLTTDHWPWDHEKAFPFGHWHYSSFLKWLRVLNSERKEEGENPLSEEEAWRAYRPEDVDNLARQLVKKSAAERGSRGWPMFFDDISGIFIEREGVIAE